MSPEFIDIYFWRYRADEMMAYEYEILLSLASPKYSGTCKLLAFCQHTSSLMSHADLHRFASSLQFFEIHDIHYK